MNKKIWIIWSLLLGLGNLLKYLLNLGFVLFFSKTRQGRFVDCRPPLAYSTTSTDATTKDINNLIFSYMDKYGASTTRPIGPLAALSPLSMVALLSQVIRLENQFFFIYIYIP